MRKLYTNQMFLKNRVLWPIYARRRVLLIMILLTTFIKGYSQNENFVIDLQDASLKEVMRAIKKQSGYSFLYQDDLLAEYGRKDFHVDTNGIDAVMNMLLSGTNLTYEVENGVIILKVAANPITVKPIAAIQVSGVVSDNKGQPMPGVSVYVKGTTRGTVTNNEGYYTLDVKEGEVLVFSFIGFTVVEMPVNGANALNVVMEEDVSELGEVVITGYQDIRKESFTGSAVTITGDELKRVNPVNVFQSIQAYDPSFRIMENNLLGSNPNRLPEINVRGTTGLPADVVSRDNLRTNPNLPTFILDGFEVNMQTVYDLDVNRIASITLLKDAAATAIYGSRAANGVLVITTKVPEEGKLQFSYNYELTASSPDLTVYDVLNASEKLEYEYLAGLYDANRNRAKTQDEYDQLYYNKKREILRGVDSYWLSEPVETAIGHKHSFTVEGGSQNIRYGVTGQYQTLPGVMKGSERKRYGGNVYLSYNLNDKFTFRNTLSISQVDSKESPYGNFEDFVRMNPYYAKRDSTGKVLRELDSWQSVVRNTVTDAEEKRTDAVLNPLYDATLSSFDKSKYTQIINSFSANWNITEALMLKGTISLTKYSGSQDAFTSPLDNQYYGYSYADLNKRGDYYFAQTEETTVDGNIILSYNTVLDNHIINTSLGGNLRDFTAAEKSFWARGFTNDKFDNIGFANQYYDNDSPNGSDETNRLVGSFLTLNYSYADRYFLQATGRLDGSSNFGTDKKYAPFWSTGIGWNLHKESFLAENSTINELRITATTGITGDVSFPPYLGKTTYEYYQNWYSTGVGARYMGYGNDNLTWQRTQNYDLKANVIVFNNRITVSPGYYYKLTEDLIADISVPPSLGYGSYKDNLGEMENKGYELGLKLEVIRNSKWNVSLTANLAHNENKLKSLSNALSKFNEEADDLQEEKEYQTVPLTRFQEGRSLETIYAVPSLGIDPENGKEIYLKKDGTLTYVYDVKDIAPVGDKTPTLYGFFGGTASYNNFMLYLSFYTRFGGDQYNQTLVDRVENADARYNVDQRVLDERWREPGDHTFYKDIADAGSTRATSRFVQADKVLELKTISLSYDVPAVLRSRLRMQMLRCVVTMNDAWRWSAVKMERGIEYPFARSVTFSLQTRF